MRRWKRWIGLAFLALSFTLISLTTNSPPGQTQADPQAQLEEIADDINAGNAALAVPKLQALSQSQPGTDIDGQSQLTLAFLYARPLRDLARARQVYQDVAARFRDSVWGFTAEVNLLDTRLLVDGMPFPDYLREISTQIVRAGGPSLDRLRSGQKSSILPVSYLTAQRQQELLGWLYLLAAGRMSDQAQSDKQLLRESINIQIFVIDALPALFGSDATQTVREDILKLNGQREAANSFPADQFPPRISKAKPQGQVGPRSDIVVKLNDGDFTESQANVGALILQVDGIEVGRTVSAFTKTARKLKPGKIFQKTKLRYRPLQPFGPGTHQVSLRIADLAGNQVEKTWSFEVRNQKKDDRDDEAGDDRCDREPDDSDD